MSRKHFLRHLHPRSIKVAFRALKAHFKPRRTHPSATSRLLDLPPELRLRIYTFLTPNRSEDPIPALLALLLVCRLINVEVTQELPRYNAAFLTILQNDIDHQVTDIYTVHAPTRFRSASLLQPQSADRLDSITLYLPVTLFSGTDPRLPKAEYLALKAAINILGAAVRRARLVFEFNPADFNTGNEHLRNGHSRALDVVLQFVTGLWERRVGGRGGV